MAHYSEAEELASNLGLQTDAYRLLATQLSSQAVASLRIDKRAIGRSITAEPDIATLSMIEIQGRTHTLKQVVSAASDQSAEYTNPALPLAQELVGRIVAFIQSVSRKL